MQTPSLPMQTLSHRLGSPSFCTTYESNNYLDADPLEADDSHEVFMMDEGETPPPPDDDEAMSNGTVVWA